MEQYYKLISQKNGYIFYMSAEPYVFADLQDLIIFLVCEMFLLDNAENWRYKVLRLEDRREEMKKIIQIVGEASFSKKYNELAPQLECRAEMFNWEFSYEKMFSPFCEVW